jgi:serine-type D-Ala-D-Ala carboxypeptidase/endopeptidase (penicillin-binding protein 4)
MKGRFNYQSIQLLILNYSLLITITSCSIEKQIGKSAKADVLDTKALQTAHIGISIFDPASNKYLYNYQGDKYFVPASNTKLPTCYAAMKYLGDSLVGLRYRNQNDSTIEILGTGDPTFLNSDFLSQPALQFLTKSAKYIAINFLNWKDEKYGSGWTWNDYLEDYMRQRSPLPIYGNVIKFKLTSNFGIDYYFGTPDLDGEFTPSYFNKQDIFKKPFAFNTVDDKAFTQKINKGENIYYKTIRLFDNNTLYTIPSFEKPITQNIPLETNPLEIMAILSDTLHKSISTGASQSNSIFKTIHSQATDSLLKPMMHRSDNFFAEQSLLMVSNEGLGVMNDEKIIDTLLKTDFSDLPQKPRWVDGSGLSRYNLFTPQDFVAILNKMKNEFGMERLKVILPTGGEGTISSYYKADSGYIYGKTGTLSGVVAFSGFLYTKKGKLLIFSTLINNHQATATEVRKAVEKFLQGIRNKY